MSEIGQLSTEQRLDAVVNRLTGELSSSRPLIKVANVGNTALRIASIDTGDLFASMTLLDESFAKKVYMYGSFEAGVWSPMSSDSSVEHMATLASLAEQAEWTDMTDL